MNGPTNPTRRAAACIAAFGALGPLIALRFAGWTHGDGAGGGSNGNTQYVYDLHGTAAWAGTAATILAILIAVAAAGLWAARDPRVLALVVAGGLVGVAGTVAVTAYAVDASVSTPEDFRALPLGSTRAQVHDRLGDAPGSGSATRRGRTLTCDVYWTLQDGARHLYCYDGDVLAFKVG